MTISIKKILIILSLVWVLIQSQGLSAQTTDNKLRMSAKVQKEISDNLGFDIEFEQRFDQQITAFDKAFLEPSISYNINKNFKSGIIYRFILDQNKYKNKTYEQRSSIMNFSFM